MTTERYSQNRPAQRRPAAGNTRPTSGPRPASGRRQASGTRPAARTGAGVRARSGARTSARPGAQARRGAPQAGRRPAPSRRQNAPRKRGWQGIPPKARLALCAVVLALVVFGVVKLVGAAIRGSEERFMDNVYVNGISMSGFTRDEGYAVMEQAPSSG